MPENDPMLNPENENGSEMEPLTAAEENSATRRQGDLDKKTLKAISLAESVAAAGLVDDRLVMLAPYDVEEATLTGIQTLSENTRAMGSEIIAAKEEKKRTTQKEKDAVEALIAALRGVQKAVKRKFPDDRLKWKAYRIGKSNFGTSRVELEQDATTILDFAAADELAGITPEKITEMRELLATWMAAEEKQTEAATAVTDLLKAYEKNVSQINASRRNVQLAADTVWPYTEDDNAGTRRSFKIPVARPVS